MARDPIIGAGFSPSIAVPQVNRRPKSSEPVLEAVWNLAGATSHGGVNLPPNSLVGRERQLLKLLAAWPIDSWGDLGDVIARAGIPDAEYWLISAMVKTGTNTLGQLIETVRSDPAWLAEPSPADPIEPAGGLLGGMVSLQG